MNQQQLHSFRDQLDRLEQRLRSDVEQSTDQMRRSVGGESAGGLSDTPQHLADIGTEENLYDLTAVMQENQEHLINEITAARERIEEGSFGICEHCGSPVGIERLKAVPYARYCIGCAEELDQGRHVSNLDVGRPHNWNSNWNRDHDALVQQGEGVVSATSRPELADRHAAGTPGGGSEVGGLAGSNSGDGEPEETNLERAAAGEPSLAADGRSSKRRTRKQW